MKIIQKHKRLYQVKEGRKILFEILVSKDGKRFHSFKDDLGIVSDRNNIEECINDTFKEQKIRLEGLKKRWIQL